MADEKGSFVKSLAPEPSRDLEIALTGVARSTRRYHVAERVPTTTGQSEHAVALKRNASRAAVRAATPGGAERSPLVVAEIVLDSFHPAFAPTSSSDLADSVDRHRGSLCVLVRRVPDRRLRAADLCGYLRDGQLAHHGSYVRGVTVVNRPIACVREH
jgi:hypothetical protein